MLEIEAIFLIIIQWQIPLIFDPFEQNSSTLIQANQIPRLGMRNKVCLTRGKQLLSRLLLDPDYCCSD